ncbi:MAG: DUF1543 domain-containing protein [Candidatus Gracilibacteria bacterium]|nr:DUF1543 domain-containing protein [Candidatus Gracilibacteria bacterium]
MSKIYKNKLYGVYLGGKKSNGILEDHDLIFVVASSEDEAKLLAKSKTWIKNELHTDGIICVENIDGYKINLIKNSKEDCLKWNTKYEEL